MHTAFFKWAALGLLGVVLLSSCGSASQCLPPRSPPPPTCPSGTFADASVNDPLCLDATGQELCRGPAQDCLVCTGANFVDGCLLREMIVHQCVHACSQC
jgi:hypothetical protein